MKGAAHEPVASTSVSSADRLVSASRPIDKGESALDEDGSRPRGWGRAFTA